MLPVRIEAARFWRATQAQAAGFLRDSVFVDTNGREHAFRAGR